MTLVSRVYVIMYVCMYIILYSYFILYTYRQTQSWTRGFLIKIVLVCDRINDYNNLSETHTLEILFGPRSASLDVKYIYKVLQLFDWLPGIGLIDYYIYIYRNTYIIILLFFSMGDGPLCYILSKLII